MTFVEIGSRRIGLGYSSYIIAEISANHRQQFDEAVELVEAAKKAGADAVKLQTYTPDILTIKCNSPEFRISGAHSGMGRLFMTFMLKPICPGSGSQNSKK